VLTRITLDSALPSSWGSVDVSKLVLHHAMSVAAVPIAPQKDVLEQNDPISLPGLLDAPRTPVEKVALEDACGNGIVGGGSLDADKRSATLAQTPKWDTSLAAPVQLSGNVLSVSRGESVHDELLGLGDGRQPQQVFKLKKKPLTYLNAATATGRRSTLQLRVGGVLWREVPAFFGVPATEQVYIVRHDEAGETFITIGGAARLTTGVEVRANYRFGAGAAMPPAGALTQLAKPVAGMRSVRNVVAATGGADAESAQALAKYAPRTALLLKRAVSLADIEALAAQTADVIAARASWRWDAAGQRPAAVVTYITSASGGAASAVDAALLARLRAAMEDDAPLAVQRCLPQTASLNISVRVDTRYTPDTVTGQVKAALFAAPTEARAAGLLRPQQLGPESVVFLSHLVAAVMAVEGVSGIGSVFFDGTPFNETARSAPQGHYFDFGGTGGVIVTPDATAAGTGV